MTHEQKIISCLNASRSHLLLLSVSALLSACGGSAGSSSQAGGQSPAAQIPADTISRMGNIWLTSVNGPLAVQLGVSTHLVEAYADFIDYGQVMTQAYIDERHTLPPPNTCETHIYSSEDSLNTEPETPAFVEAFESNQQAVSAGDVIGITTTAGSWGELHIYQDFGNYYELQQDVDSFGTLPRGATLSIPGEAFPGFDAISIPHVEPIQDASISELNNRLLTPESMLTWVVPTQPNPNGFLVLSMYSYNYDNTNNIEVEISIGCRLSDNGTFSFPDDVKQLVSQYDFEINSTYFSRFSMTTDIRGDAAVQILRDSRYLF